jgi:hypothetical protein
MEGSQFHVFEKSHHWDPGAAEHQGATDVLGVTLHCCAASPAKYGVRAHGPIAADALKVSSLMDLNGRSHDASFVW